MSKLLRFCSNGNLRQVRGVLSTTNARNFATSSSNTRVAAPIEVIDKHKYRFAVGGNWTEGVDKAKVQVLKSAHVRTIRPSAERATSEVVIPTWSNDEVSNMVHEVASSMSVSDYEQVRFEEPVARAPGRLGSKPLTTNNQMYRAKLAEEKSKVDIQTMQTEWNEFVSAPKVEKFASSVAAPLEFGDNNFLKFVIIDAVMKKAGVTLSSSHLGSIANTNDLVSALVDSRDKLNNRKAKVASEFPSNVAFVVESTAKILESMKGRNQRKLKERKEREAARK